MLQNVTTIYVKLQSVTTIEVKQSLYRPGKDLRVPGGWDSQVSRQTMGT